MTQIPENGTLGLSPKWSCDPEVSWPFEFDKMVAESSRENNISHVSSEMEYLKEPPGASSPLFRGCKHWEGNVEITATKTGEF